MREYELKLSNGRVVVWNGTSGEDAARRYVETHQTDKVIAFRNYPRTGIFIADVTKIV